MRIGAVLLLLFLAACNRGNRSNDAVRQGVLDHLSKAGLNVSGMEVSLTSVQFQGSEADATVSITPKGAPAAQGMSMNYHLKQQDNNWVVVGRPNAGGSPHTGATMPQDAPNPHGGAAPAPGGAGGKMPSPEDLPPSGKKP